MSAIEGLVEALQKKVNSLGHFTHGGRDAIELEVEVEQNGDLLTRVEDLEARLAEIETQLDAIQDLGQEKSSKEEKIAALVQYAQNKCMAPETDRVALTAREIRGVAGVSRRYAYDLIDDLPGDYVWAKDRRAVRQYGSLEIDKDGNTRALVVDLELLHSNPEAVNKFTTPLNRKGASS